MSQNTTPRLIASPTSQPPKGVGERLSKPQERSARALKLARKLEKETRRDVAGSEDVARPQGETEDLKKLLDEERGVSKRLRWEKGKLNGECKAKDDRIMELEENIRKMRGTVEGQTQQIRTAEERQKQTEELLHARTAELCTAQTFLSITDRLSEAEVLSIVRDLNEVIFQVAVKLTEEWEKLEPWTATERMEVGRITRPRVSPLVQLRDRNPMGLVFQLQSCLCSQIVSMTSGRSQFKGLAELESVYKRLSASGGHHVADAGYCDLHPIEGQEISAIWRSLTYINLSRPPPPPLWLGRHLASVLDDAGSLLTPEQSLDFVRFAAREGIESIIRLALRLELAFMQDIRSSNMTLLFEVPGVVFDDARMVKDSWSEYAPAPGPGEEGKIAGTTEMGVGKSVCGGPDESRPAVILLKTTVVLEKDIIEGGEYGL